MGLIGLRLAGSSEQLGDCRQLYKNRSSRKIDSQRLFSRECDFPKTFSLTENQFSRKTYFYTIHPSDNLCPLQSLLHLFQASPLWNPPSLLIITVKSGILTDFEFVFCWCFLAFFHFGLFLYPGFGLFPLFDPLPVGQDFLRILHPKDQIASNKDLYLYVSIFTLQGGPHNFTQEIKALYTRFEKSLSIFTMTSIEKHIENFNFRSRIQFDHAAVASYPTSIAASSFSLTCRYRCSKACQ